MAIEVLVKTAKLKAAVESFYDEVAKQGLHNNEWAILGQVYHRGSEGMLARMTLMTEPWTGQIRDVVKRMEANKARTAKRKAKRKAPK